MKILILSDIQDHAKKCAEGLLELGNDIVYAYPKGMVTKGVKLDNRISKVELPYGGGKNYFLNFLSLRNLCKKIKPDVIHVHYATGFGLLATLASVHPIVISCYGSDIFDFPQKNKLNYLLLRYILRNAEGLQSTSIVMSNEIKSIIKESGQVIDIIPFGINLHKFKPIYRPKESHRPIVGFIKSLYPVYDVPLLINAFNIVLKEMKYKPLLKIVGGGPMLDELQCMVKDLKIEENVSFVGRIPNEDIPDMLNTFDVLVNSSKEESFGVNLLEAMACQVPVISTDCVGPKEVLEEGKCGILLKDRSPKTMADAIINILNNKEESGLIVENARRRIEEYYDWNKNVVQLHNSLIQVVEMYNNKNR